MTGEVSSAVRLSVPGKVILMGEHAAVYGRPAVVAAIDRRLEVEARLAEATPRRCPDAVRLELPDIGVRQECSWRALEAFTDDARRRWRAFKTGNEPFRSNHVRDALVRIAVGEALASLDPDRASRLRRRALELRLRSSIPIGAGLGSSAAAAVGVVAAVRAVAGGVGGAAPDAVGPGRKARARAGASSEAWLAGVDGKELLAVEAAAFEVERRQHGFPSGIDSGAVLRGGVLFVSRERNRLLFQDLPQPTWLRRHVAIVDSGDPQQPTGLVVSRVRLSYENEPDRVSEVFDRIGAAAEAFRSALTGGRRRDAEAAVMAGHYALVDLGVVPPAVAWRIGRVEMAGGVAKISGAGAIEAECAGALVCMLGGRPPETVEGVSDLAPVDAPIGADGLRFED